METSSTLILVIRAATNRLIPVGGVKKVISQVITANKSTKVNSWPKAFSPRE